jgi:hypothetical protein
MSPIYVFQMGKVGSSSIHEAVARAGFDTRHCHTLKPLKLTGWPERQAVITAVREPIARAISLFFQRLAEVVPEKPRPTISDVPYLCECFLRRFDYMDTTRWFDAEFLPVTGVDLLSTSNDELQTFDFGFDLLVLRQEDDLEVNQEKLREFLGAPDLTLYRSNVTEEHQSKGLVYKVFKDYFIAPKEMLRLLGGTRYIRRFDYWGALEKWEE